jgi:hypothetical protein
VFGGGGLTNTPAEFIEGVAVDKPRGTFLSQSSMRPACGSFKPGVLVGVAGGVWHAGPKSKIKRTCLFFAVGLRRPGQAPPSPYDANFQINIIEYLKMVARLPGTNILRLRQTLASIVRHPDHTLAVEHAIQQGCALVEAEVAALKVEAAAKKAAEAAEGKADKRRRTGFTKWVKTMKAP